MDEETRKRRELDALEGIALRLEELRLLREYELGVRIGYEEGDPQVRPVEEG